MASVSSSSLGLKWLVGEPNVPDIPGCEVEEVEGITAADDVVPADDEDAS